MVEQTAILRALCAADGGTCTVNGTQEVAYGANGAFDLFFRFSTETPDFRVLGPGVPSIDISAAPKVVTGANISMISPPRACRANRRRGNDPAATPTDGSARLRRYRSTTTLVPTWTRL